MAFPPFPPEPYTSADLDAMFHPPGAEDVPGDEALTQKNRHIRRLWRHLRDMAGTVATQVNYDADPSSDGADALRRLVEAGVYATSAIEGGHVSPNPVEPGDEH